MAPVAVSPAGGALLTEKSSNAPAHVSALHERARVANPYAQPFALSEHFKATRNGGEAVAEKKEDFFPDLSEKVICPDCQSDPPNLTEEFANGDLVCAECGMVVGNIIDTRSEWRTFSNEDGDDPSRVGQSNNPLMDGLMDQLDTRISFRDGGSGVARDLQRALNRGVTSTNRTILDGFDEIQRLCDVIHLPRTVSETAKVMFKKVEQDQILPRANRSAIIAATIYCACKTNKVPRTFREICQLTNVRVKAIGKCFQLIQSAYGLNHARPDALGAVPGGEADIAVQPTNAVDLIARFSNRLGLENNIIRCAEDVASILRDKGILAGRSPNTIAATCIYLSAHMLGNQLTAKEVSNAAPVTDVTIKSSSRDLLALKTDWLTPAILTKYPSLDTSLLT